MKGLSESWSLNFGSRIFLYKATEIDNDLYQLAYQEFINDHNFSAVKNRFLMPTEKAEVIDKEEVSMQMLSKFGLPSIKVRFLPAKMVYENYLSGRKMDISLLKL